MPSTLKLFLGALCIGFAPVFVKLLEMPPTVIGFYRCLFAAAGLFFLSAKQPNKHSPKRRWILAAGAAFAIDLYVWHRSVVYAGAGLGTILGNTQVFYTSLFGLLFLGEKLKLRFWFAVILAFAGIYLLVGFHRTPSEHYWAGVGFGVSTGIVYALYILCMRQAEGESGLPSGRLLAEVSLVCALVLLPVCLAEHSLRLPTGNEWIWILALAGVAQITGWWLISGSLRAVPVSQAGLILLTQPAVATLMGALLFGEALGLAQASGAVLTFGAIYLGATGRDRQIKLPPQTADK
ncbi:MAG: DMT family transporter [Bdellovibrionales bacterium]|nr:DMT family transporter [Bdellovibrionales bacterium]